MRIPYDGLVLAAVADEIRPLVGQTLAAVSQPERFTLHLALGPEVLLLCADPDLYRVHLTSRRSNVRVASRLGSRLVKAALNRALLDIEQPEGDRVLLLRFEGGATLAAEMAGTHADLRLLTPEGEVDAALRGKGEGLYVPPGGGFRGGPSPFLKRLLAAEGRTYEEVRRGPWTPHLSDEGAYPLDLAPLDIASVPKASLSAALETAASSRYRAIGRERLRASLAGQLTRVLEARDAALHAVEDALRTGGRAGGWQRTAELLLAYGPTQPQAQEVEAYDHEGHPVRIAVDEGGDWRSTAERLFARARRAKSGARSAGARREELEGSRDELLGALLRVEGASEARELEAVRETALRKRWLLPAVDPKRPEDRPYGGQKVEEFEAPHGYRVLVGGNAEANEYLTLRVARPTDLWLHVLGAPGSHVILRTDKQPERVPPETVRYAAWLAARHSGQKHAAWVPVIVTERRYVRKQRHAPPGTVQYSHERTVYADPTGESR